MNVDGSAISWLCWILNCALVAFNICLTASVYITSNNLLIVAWWEMWLCRKMIVGEKILLDYTTCQMHCFTNFVIGQCDKSAHAAEAVLWDNCCLHFIPLLTRKITAGLLIASENIGLHLTETQVSNHTRSIWIYVCLAGHLLSVQLSCLARTLMLDITSKLLHQICYTCMPTGTVDFTILYHFQWTWPWLKVTGSVQSRTSRLHFLYLTY